MKYTMNIFFKNNNILIVSLFYKNYLFIYLFINSSKNKVKCNTFIFLIFLIIIYNNKDVF